MSAGLAHEIRNPIGAMRLQAENALAKDTVQTYQKACRGMLQNISRLDDLLERLLAIVRLDRLTLTSTKILPWLEECIMPFRNAPGNVAIDVEAPETEWSFDEQQLSRALHNLIANAVQHTPPNGWVKVTAKKENGQLGNDIETMTAARDALAQENETLKAEVKALKTKRSGTKAASRKRRRS